MTPTEAADSLRSYNKWRRGNLAGLKMPSPRETGEAIDAAIDMIDRLEAAEKECDSLRAKVEAMEKQEPVATARINAINGNPSVDFVPGHRYLHHNDKLYLAPGAKGEIK